MATSATIHNQMMRRTLLALAALVVALLVGMLAARPAHAETFTVNSTNHPGTDGCDASECTLKEAINAANTNAQGDTIDFAPGLSGEIELSNSSPEAGGFTIQNDTLDEDLRIDGPGAGVLAVDGNNQTRAFSIASGANATIEGLTIKNGYHPNISGGGGIYNNHGTLTVTSSTLSGNTASYYGGGIHNEGGTLTVTNSTLNGHNTASWGGGIANYGAGTLTVTSSTLSGNSAVDKGGGIHSAGGALTVTSSTLSGNTASYGGGGIAHLREGGALTVTNSTLIGNYTNGSGGGIYSHDVNMGGTQLVNTIVAGNTAAQIGPDAYGEFTSQGYNLIGNSADSSGWIGSDLLNRDPLLGPLQDNGGPTNTHALLPGSPAINAIPNTTNGCGTEITTDQRGVSRPQEEKCEIGSFELQDSIPPNVKSVSPTGKKVSPKANVTATFSEAMNEASVEASGTFTLKKKGSTKALSATVTYDPNTKKATLDPTNKLRSGATYIAKVTTAAKDLAGNALDQNSTTAGNQPKSWRFKVK